MSDNSSSGGCGCGCGGAVITILILWALFIGLPTPWGNVNIDILPPAIRVNGR